ncbi:MAG TPA: permease-like cell division protein FtsX, partial [Kofleriaceae bacterium]|nr:permease-like cell division protein FtsX [Kofleriaceae bacterium]
MIHRALATLRRSLALAVRRPALAVWTQLALTCALFLAGAAGLAADAIDHWADAHPDAGGRMVVYLGDGVAPARAIALTAELRGLRGVERAELISADESARRLGRALGADPALLDGVDVASLPASVEVTLAPGVRDVIAMSPTLRALRGAPGVADVVVPAAVPDGPAGTDDPLAPVLRVARELAWLAAAVFAGLALVVVLAALRLRLDRSPREAAVLHLLGASPAFTAVPSALAGAWQGALAGGLAVVALAALV